LHGLRSGYLHERNQVLHWLHPAPLQIDPGLFESPPEFLRNLYRRRSETLSFKQLKPEDQAIVERYQYLFEIAGDAFSLNEFGYLLCQQGGMSTITVEIGSGILGEFPGADQRRVIRTQARHLAHLVEQGVRTADLFHEREAASKMPPGRNHLYKGSSNGQMIFRAWYQAVPEEGPHTLKIKKVWAKSRSIRS